MTAASTSRGLTLIETLVSLVLLSGLLLASTSWLQIAGRTGAEGPEPLRWRSAAMNAIEQMVVDVRSVTSPAEGEETEAIVVDSSRLTIHTRSSLPIALDDQTTTAAGNRRHVYEFDSHERMLKLIVQSIDGSTKAIFGLLDDVEIFEATLNRENGTLRIRIEGVDGQIVQRTIRGVASEGLNDDERGRPARGGRQP